MESIPPHARGFVSGLLQSGYPTGYFLASIVYGLLFQYIGWRGMFMVGVIPALLVFYIRRSVPESPSWTPTTASSSTMAILKSHWRLGIYAVLLMTAFNFFSHGTQDLYPTFLEKQRGFDVGQKSMMTIVYALGAICGGTVIGFMSQRWGRRRSIILAAACGMLLIPVWIFSPGTGLLVVGGFLMQFMVQGAWGVVPVHLNELSPREVRGTFPGLAYQLGNCAAAYAAQQQAWLAERFRTADGNPNYALTMASVQAVVFLAIIILAAVGREKRGIEF